MVEFVRPDPTKAVALPAEAAFLAGVLPADLLLDAMARARAQDVPLDVLIRAEGLLDEDAFYRAFARRHDLLFLEGDIPLANATRPLAIEAGLAELAPGACPADYVFAPQGLRLAALANALARPGSTRSSAAIATPRRFAAAVRARNAQSIAREAAHGLADARPEFSAKSPAPPWQRHALAIGFAAVALACLPVHWLAQLCAILLSLAFLAALVVRLGAAVEMMGVKASAPAPPLKDRDLPVYTILVPLYREARVAGDLVAALDALDYPAAKLDIKLLVESCDGETRAALEGMALPARYEILCAPQGAPRTKPRALNVGLAFARGDLVTVYDAEDRPEPDQLRRAAARFARAPRRLACLQARLAIDNTGDCWLSRLFGLEYAGLFGVLNPGFARLSLPIPLGGTSNHFRRAALRAAGGWDAWNVTEDADLGLRLARLGYFVEALDSVTWEEAPVTLSAWLGQRSRWIKGWMQTLLVHSRDPSALRRDLGLLSAVAALATIGGAVAAALFAPVFVASLAVGLWSGALLAPADPLSLIVASLSAPLAVAGLSALILPVLLAAPRRGPAFVAALLSLPAYFLLCTLAAWRALFELRANPFGWTKTEHGLARRRARNGAEI